MQQDQWQPPTYCMSMCLCCRDSWCCVTPTVGTQTVQTLASIDVPTSVGLTEHIGGDSFVKPLRLFRLRLPTHFLDSHYQGDMEMFVEQVRGQGPNACCNSAGLFLDLLLTQNL